MALSGGKPLGIIGEWNGSVLRPLGLWVAGRLVHWRGTDGS